MDLYFFTGNFNQIFKQKSKEKNKQIPVLYKLLENRRKESLPNLFNDNHNPNIKPIKDTEKMSLMNTDAGLKKKQLRKKYIIHHDYLGFI